MPNALIIILNWNKKEFLQGLLERVRKLGYFRHHVLVVDNASTDGSQEMVKTMFPEAALIENEVNLGGTGGFNTGLRYGMTEGPFDYIWLLDNDAKVHEGALEGLLEAAESDPRIGMVGSKILFLEEPDKIQEIGADVDWLTGSLLKRDNGPDHDRVILNDVEYVAACSMLVRVDAVRRVGIWDENYFITWDDIEWGHRFNRAGFRVVATSKSVIEHEGFDGRRALTPVTTFYYAGRNALYMFWKYCYGWKRVVIFYKVLTALLLNLYTNHKMNGQLLHAACLRLGVRDFLLGRMGRSEHDFSKYATHHGDEAESLEKRTGKLLLIASPNKELNRQAYDYVIRAFPDYHIDVFVSSAIGAVKDLDLPNRIDVDFSTPLRRLKFLRSTKGTYDASLALSADTKYFFEYFLPARIVVFEDGTHKVIRAGARDTAKFVWTKFACAALVPIVTAACLLKPRRKHVHEFQDKEWADRLEPRCLAVCLVRGAGRALALVAGLPLALVTHLAAKATFLRKTR